MAVLRTQNAAAAARIADIIAKTLTGRRDSAVTAGDALSSARNIHRVGVCHVE
jgi:hypothetical protein